MNYDPGSKITGCDTEGRAWAPWVQAKKEKCALRTKRTLSAFPQESEVPLRFFSKSEIQGTPATSLSDRNPGQGAGSVGRDASRIRGWASVPRGRGRGGPSWPARP